LSKYNDQGYSEGSGYYESPFIGTGIASITVPEGVTAIPAYAFRNMTSLQEIDLPTSLSTVRNYAFQGTTKLIAVDFPASLVSIGNYSFASSGLSMLNLPGLMTSIGNYAFQNCIGLRNIYLNGLSSVPQSAFDGCSGLVSVVLNDELTSIGSASFANCINLTSLYVPLGVETFQTNSFSNCPKLTLYCYSGSKAHLFAEANKIPFKLLDEHEHIYESTIETEANCTREGSQVLTCSICGYSYIELTEPLGHIVPEEFTVVKEPTCTEEGHLQKICERCGEILEEEHPAALGHDFGEWIIVKEASIYNDGLRYRICNRDGTREEEILPQTELSESMKDAYGMASLRVVDATTKAPLVGAQLTVKLNEEDTLVLTTDENGQVEQLLPVGALRMTVYVPGKIARSVTIHVTKGSCVIPDIGLSDAETVDAKLTVTEMTYDEIIAAGIDVNAEDNQHVYKYAIKLEFAPHIDVLNMFYYMNMGGFYFPGGFFTTGPGSIGPGEGGGGGGNGGGGGTSEYWTFVEPSSTSSHLPVMRYDNPETEEVVTVYPVSEQFFLIIYGEVRWLKEMFDVEMLVINNSLTDTLEDCVATLSLPQGVSLATMVGEQQTFSKALGTIESGEQKSAHWYIRGDEEGDYHVTARLTGVMQPFGEEIDRVYTTENSFHVYAGSAMHLTYYVPDAAYYGQDYIVRAELENVSPKTLYNVGHLITGIHEYKLTHYSDGLVKQTDYLKTGQVASNFAHEFRPGDKLVIEMHIPIFFQSEIIQQQLDDIKTGVRQIEKLSNALHMFDVASDAITGFGSFFDSLWSMNGIGKIEDIGSNLKAINDGLAFTQTILDHPDEKEAIFNAYDALCNVIDTIPIRFDLIRSSVEVLEGSTTEIPTTIVTVHESGEPWAINFGQYMTNFVIAALDDFVDAPETGIWPIDFTMDKMLDAKKALTFDKAKEYLKSVDGEVQTMLTHAANAQVKVRVWSEHGSLDIEPVNADYQMVGGVAEIDGGSYLHVTSNGRNDTLFIDAGGNVQSFQFESYPPHTHAGSWKTVWYATEYTEGLEVERCDICGSVLDVRKTHSCGDHHFSAYVTDVEPKDGNLGIQTRVCEVCHVLEYRFINEDGAIESNITFDANGGEGTMSAEVATAGVPMLLPENGFAHEKLQFVCWNTRADGTGENHAPGESMIFDDDTVLYAIWSETGLLTYDFSGVHLSEILIPYDTQIHEVTLEGLPEGVQIGEIHGHQASEPGIYTVSATLLAGDVFHAPEHELTDLTWEIRRALKYVGEDEREYNGSGSLPGGLEWLVQSPISLSYVQIAEDGAEVALDEAPVNAGSYRFIATMPVGDAGYEEEVTGEYRIVPRKLTITPRQVRYEYDGEVVQGTEVIADRLISGDSLSEFAIDGDAVLPGLYEKLLIARDAKILNRLGEDITDNYEITYGSANLEILKRTVTVQAGDVEVVYDGHSHTTDEWTAEHLLDGHEVRDIVITGEGTNAGRYSNWLKPTEGIVVDADGNDLMDLYQFRYLSGSMTINLRPLIIVPDEVVHEYDATLVENPDYTVDNLAPDQEMYSLEILGGKTKPGKYPGEFIPRKAVIVDAEENETTSNYKITYLASDLTIEKRRVRVTAYDLTVTYDDELHQGTEVWADRLLDGHELSDVVFADAYLRDAGIYPEAIEVVDAVVVDEDGTELMDLYQLSYQAGKLTINRRPTVIAAGDRTWEYDDTTVHGEEYTAENLVEGHSVSSLDIQGEGVVPGTYVLTPESAEIMRDGEEVTGNYDITYIPGKLSITRRELVLTADDVTVVYDGLSHAGDGNTTDRLLTGHVATVLEWTDAKVDAGTYADLLMPKTVEIRDAKGEAITDRYEITFVPSALTIEKRPATITAKALTHEYDDQAVTSEQYTASNLAGGESVGSVTIDGTATLPGTYDGLFVPKNAKILNEDKKDTTDNYTLTYVAGKLTISKRKLTVTAKPVKLTYDGMPHGGSGVTADRLLTGHTITDAVIENEQTRVGTYENELQPVAVTITDAKGNEVTSRYEIAYADAELAILARPMTVTAKSVKQEYNGSAVTSSDFSVQGAVEGHTVTSVITGSKTVAGTYKNAFAPTQITVKDASGADVTNQYKITAQKGDLTITAKLLTLTVDKSTVVYDGLTHDESTFTLKGMVSGQEFTVSAWMATEAVLAGEYKSVLQPASYAITTKAGENVTSSYAIAFVPGDLVITRRPVTVTATATSAEYTGKARTGSKYTSTGLAEGDELTATITGSATVPGTYADKLVPSSVSVTDSQGEDVTDSYEITTVKGQLTVTKRKLTITANPVTVLYDGKEHGAEDVTADRLISGDTIYSFKKDGKASDPGTHTGLLKISDAVIHNAKGEDVSSYYNITYINGTLTIDIIPVEKIELSSTALYLKTGEKVQVMAKVAPDDASLPEIVWKSSNAKIATVENGIITKLAKGEATIQATVSDGSGVVASILVRDDDLKCLQLPAALSTVEDEAWYGNVALQSVSAAKAVTIGHDAFKDCSGLLKMDLPAGSTFQSDAFDGCSNVVLYVHDASAAEQARSAGVAYVIVSD
ncbi:MAG: leucine-rich repeat protein, partial [Clostridia bacterium]|nr:leucine-rich repeat protein [Clostridia bacterium]MBR1686795.1 leucine-rich repeat protein [Clostridia bacterium]